MGGKNMKTTTIFQIFGDAVRTYVEPFRSLVDVVNDNIDDTPVTVKELVNDQFKSRRQEFSAFGHYAKLARRYPSRFLACSTAIRGEEARKNFFINRKKRKLGLTEAKVEHVKGIIAQVTGMGYIGLPTSPKKALDILPTESYGGGFQLFFKGTQEEFDDIMRKMFGIHAWSNDIFSVSPGAASAFVGQYAEKAFKYMNAKYRQSTVRTTWTYVMDMDATSVSKKLKRWYGISKKPDEITASIDGTSFIHEHAFFSVENGLLAGDVLQVRGNADLQHEVPGLLPLNAIKGTMVVVSDNHWDVLMGLLDIPVDHQHKDTLYAWPDTTKCLGPGVYRISNFAIHAKWDDRETKKVRLGIQAISRSLKFQEFLESALGKEWIDRTKEVRDALHEYGQGNEGPLRSLFGDPNKLSAEVRGAIDEFVAGAPFELVNRGERLTKAVGSLLKKMFGIAVPGRREYFVSPLFAWSIGIDVQTGEAVISKAVGMSGVVNKENETCINRSPILVGLGAAIPVRVVASWYINGTAVNVPSAITGHDYDGDKMSVFARDYLNTVTWSEYWTIARRWLKSLNAWDGDVSKLGYPTSDKVKVKGAYYRSLYLGGMADMGIPIMDSLATEVSMKAKGNTKEMIPWKLQAAYQSVISLVKHSAGQFVDVEAIMKKESLRDSDPIAEFILSLKGRDILDRAYCTEKEDGTVIGHRDRFDAESKVSNPIWKTFAQNFERISGVSKKLHRDASEGSRYVMKGKDINPFFAYILDIKSLRRLNTTGGFIAPYGLSVFGNLAARLAVMSGETTGLGNISMVPDYAGSKRLSRERLFRLVRYIARERCFVEAAKAEGQSYAPEISDFLTAMNADMSQIDMILGDEKHGRSKGLSLVWKYLIEMLNTQSTGQILMGLFGAMFRAANMENGNAEYLRPFFAELSGFFVPFTEGIVAADSNDIQSLEPAGFDLEEATYFFRSEDEVTWDEQWDILNGEDE